MNVTVKIFVVFLTVLFCVLFEPVTTVEFEGSDICLLLRLALSTDVVKEAWISGFEGKLAGIGVYIITTSVFLDAVEANIDKTNNDLNSDGLNHSCFPL